MNLILIIIYPPYYKLLCQCFTLFPRTKMSIFNLCLQAVMEQVVRAGSSKETIDEDSNCDKDEDGNLEVTYDVPDAGGNKEKVTNSVNEFPDSNSELLERKHENTCEKNLVEGLAELSLTEERLPSEELDSECTPEGNTAQPLQTIDKDADLERDKTEEIERVEKVRKSALLTLERYCT